MKRRCTIALLCLLAGAAINVLVAWGWIAVFGVPSLQSEPVDAHPLLWKGYQGDQVTPDGTHTQLMRTVGVTYVTGLWRRKHDPDEFPFNFIDGRRRFVLAAGVPMRCLYYHRTGPGFLFSGNDTRWLQGPDRLSDGLDNPWRGPRGGFDPAGVFPTLPLWPGFAVNSVFYGGLIWIVVFAPFTARRAHRRRHGLCAKCGYAMEGLATCPECGASGQERACANLEAPA